MRLRLISAVAVLASASTAAAGGSCTNSYATNYNASALTDDGSCTYPNTVERCGAQPPYVTPIRIMVTAAQKDFKFSVDATMMSARSYGPFTNFGQGTVPPSGAVEMVLCVDADGPSGREHTLQYQMGGDGNIEIKGLDESACPNAMDDVPCTLLDPTDFDPSKNLLTIHFHVGRSPPPPPVDPGMACRMAYTETFLSMNAGGRCDHNSPCSAACQTSITQVLRMCRNTTFQDAPSAECINSAGSAVRCALNAAEKGCSSSSKDCSYIPEGVSRPFDHNAVESFQTNGPADCDYSLGYESCDSQCTMKNFVNPSGSFSGLANCVKIVHGEPKWETQCSDECAEQFATVEEHCGECEDPQIKHYLETAAAGLGRCASCPYGTAEVIKAACCPDGRGCNEFGEPEVSDADCCAAITVAGSAEECPEYFLKNEHRIGTYSDCDGNSEDQLKKNLHTKHASHASPGGPAPAPETHELEVWAIVLLVLGGLVLVGCVFFQFCTMRSEKKEFARDSLAFARDGSVSSSFYGDRLLPGGGSDSSVNAGLE